MNIAEKTRSMSQWDRGMKGSKDREHARAFRWVDGAFSIPQAFVKVSSRSSAAAHSIADFMLI